MPVLAKSKKCGVTLREHVEDVLRAAERMDLPSDLKELLEKAILYHDLGKVLPSFQKKVGNDEFSILDGNYRDIPHSFASVVFIPKGLLSELKDEAKILLSAVVYHHWRDSYLDFLFGKKREEVARVFGKLLEDGEKLVEILKEEMGDSCEIDFNRSFAEYLTRNSLIESGLILPPHLLSLLPSVVLRDLNLKDETYKKYVLVTGALMRADRFASYCEMEQRKEDLDKVEIVFSEDSFEIVGKKLTENFGRSWQENVLNKGYRGENMILVAPTGAGKTEFGLMWSKGKTIFTLPLRSATNMIYERVREYFGQENVGLLHSDADVHIYSSEHFDEEGEVMRIVELARFLSYPFIVSTGDQIFPAALKYPSYEMIYSVLSGSYLIVDEVQSYSPEAAAVVVKLLEDVNYLGGKFLVMTATLPGFIKEEIQKRTSLDLERKVVDVFGEIPQGRLKRTVIQFLNSCNLLEETKKFFNSGKRVLIVRNKVISAVETCKKLRESLGEENVFLIHSQMTQEDRRTVEKKLEEYRPGRKGKPVVLVSTQVVEASLDIDFDVLFTDVAPVDALVQRMGRVYRKREWEGWEKGEPNVFVLVGSNEKERESLVRGVYRSDLIDKTLETIREITGVSDLSRQSIRLEENVKKEWVEKTYEKLKKEEKRGYLKRFYEVLDILDSGYASERKLDALRVFRQITTFDVIPENLLNALIEEFKGVDTYIDFKRVISKYLVSAPVYALRRENLIHLESVTTEVGFSREISRWSKGLFVLRGGKYERGLGLVVEE